MKNGGNGQSLSQFLIDLADVLWRARAWVEDPDSVIDEADLSEEDKEILRSKDLEQVKAAVAKEHPDQTVVFIIWGIW
jgi:hypothetical protein